MSKKWSMLLVIISSVLIIALVGCQPGSTLQPTATQPSAQPSQTTAKPAPPAVIPKAASVGTMPKGGLTNVLGASLAKVISDNTGMASTDRPFTGYLSYVPLINKGEVDMGIVTAPELYYAYYGQDPYKEKNSNLRLLFCGTMLQVSFFTRADSSIKNISDAKGKRVVFDTASKLTAETVTTILKANGLDPEKDITKVATAGVVAAIQAVGEGRTDMGWSAIGAAETKEVAAKVGGVYWPPVSKSKDDAAAQYIRDHLPGVDVGAIKAGGAPEVNNDTWVPQYPYSFVTSKDFSEEAVYQSTKAIWQHEADLVAIHPNFKGWQKAMVSLQATVPYHLGAIRFYKEVNAWTPEMDKLQAKLLAQ
jgi:TRAP transporter TAXI family solute receptor